MKHTKKLLSLLLVLCLILSLSCTAFAADEAKPLTGKTVILHSNDVHGAIDLYAAMASLKADYEAQGAEVILADAGDYSQGTVYVSVHKGADAVTMMNATGYDVATIGNHEFDYGLDNMARIFRMAKFPVVCANYDFTGTPVEGIVKPYVILKRNGLRIGVLGICPQMLGLVDENKCVGVKYLDPVETADRIAKKLKKEEKCDVVICLSHLGWGLAQNVDDEDMIARNHDIDIVLGGHSHSYFTTLKYAKNADGRMIPDDQNGKHAIFVGKIMMKLDKAK